MECLRVKKPGVEYRHGYSSQVSGKRMVCGCQECRTLNASRLREYRKNNPGYAKAQNLKHFYGLSVAEYETMMVTCGGLCEACRDAPVDNPLGVDHDHTTDVVRGMLCGRCNAALGLLLDDPDRIDKLLAYRVRFPWK